MVASDSEYDLGNDNFNDEDLLAIAQSLSRLGIDVLLLGETGTGKDTVANRIHSLSGRTGPMISINCAAIPETLAESELFGVVSGAFTGADRSRIGYIEAAQGGTLYLDEIDSMSLNLQAKLLRVLETRTLERLGSTSSVMLDICVIASAQRSLDELVERGVFRRDLYFRLNVLTLRLPALRAQPSKILPLFLHFAVLAAEENKIPLSDVDSTTKEQLQRHDWPGNIRELKSAAKRFVLGFPVLGTETREDQDSVNGLKSQLRVIEKVLIQEALKRHGHNVDAASEELGVPRRTLYHRIRALDI